MNETLIPRDLKILAGNGKVGHGGKSPCMC